MFVLRPPDTQMHQAWRDRLKKTWSKGRETKERGGKARSGLTGGSLDNPPSQVHELLYCSDVNHGALTLRQQCWVPRALWRARHPRLSWRWQSCKRNIHGSRSNYVPVGKQERCRTRFTDGISHRKRAWFEAGKSGSSPWKMSREGKEEDGRKGIHAQETTSKRQERVQGPFKEY